MFADPKWVSEHANHMMVDDEEVYRWDHEQQSEDEEEKTGDWVNLWVYGSGCEEQDGEVE